MSRSVIHIGANKTASTTLQRCLFSKSTGLVYLGEDCPDYEKYKETLDSLVWDDEIHFCSETARALFKKFSMADNERTFVYSNEDIMRSRVPAQCARRLYAFLPEAEILVVVRNQLTAIPSWYANHGAYLKMVPRRYWRRYVAFDEWMQYCMEFMKYSPLDGFFYHKMVNLYASFFGKERIHVLLYEHFVDEEERFIANLCRVLRIGEQEASKLLLGNRERTRNTMRVLRYHQFRNWFFPGRCLSTWLPCGALLARMWWDFVWRGAPADGFMSDYWRNRIIELYKEDNTELADEYGLPLKEYEYPVA